jgi:hypothetical protein
VEVPVCILLELLNGLYSETTGTSLPITLKNWTSSALQSSGWYFGKTIGYNHPMGISMEVFPGITMDPEVRFGKPCIAGTRIDVATVLGRFAAGDKIEERPRLHHNRSKPSGPVIE